MKIKKNFIRILTVLLIMCFSVNTFAFAPKATKNNINTDALKRMEKLGLIDKLKTEGLDASQAVTREELAKMLVIAAGLQSTADSLKSQSIFSDVKSKDAMAGYINAAINKGFLTGMADKKFHPKDNATFAQFCTSAIKLLGYGDNDVSGVWPNNYIEKAKSLKLLEGISIKNNDSVSRGAAAMIMERLLDTNIKKSGSQDGEKTLLAAAGVFADAIILGNRSTITGLIDNQILTDKGIFNLQDNSGKLEVGNRYRMMLEDDNIIKVYYSLKSIKNIVVNNIKANIITYQDNKKTEVMTLPDKVVYYYNGVKQNYDNLKNIIQNETTISFAYSPENIGYEYAVIIDPIYSKPVIVDEENLGAQNIGNIRIMSGEKIIKNGEFIGTASIMPGDVAYEVSDLLNSGKYIIIIDSKVEGKLTNILPNRLYPNVIQIDNKNYDISKDMDLTKLISANSDYKLGDTVQIFNGYDGKIVDISKNTVMGVNGEYIILGNSSTLERLSQNQILTDKGILYLANDSIKLELGSKYRLFVKNERILKKTEVLNTLKRVVVNNIIDATITYGDGNREAKMTLHDKVIYYYQGIKQNYENLKNIIQTNSTIIFVNNSDNIGYEYAVILDPIYSKPEIVNNFKNGAGNIGNIGLDDVSTIIKNGEYVDLNSITNGSVVYKVSDIGYTNKYLLLVENIVKGKLTAILPNKLNPKAIQVDNKNYDISKDMDIKKIINQSSLYKINDTIQITLGYDNKVLNIDLIDGQNNDNIACVINTTSALNGTNPVNTVKLLKTDGTVYTYKTNMDYRNLKGTLVTYTILNDETVELAAFQNQSIEYGDIKVNKDEMKIGDYYVSDNVRVFNVISNDTGIDANVEVLSWSDLYTGVIQAGKVLFLNHVGEFEDINVMLLNDIYDEVDNYGLVKSISYSATGSGGRTMLFNFTIGVNGKDYKWSTTYTNGAEINKIVKVRISNGQIVSCSGVANYEAKGTKIQAIDTKKIKLNNNIYKFREDVIIYYKDRLGNISTKISSEIVVAKTYGSVEIYLDKALSYGGKVKIVVISE